LLMSSVMSVLISCVSTASAARLQTKQHLPSSAQQLQVQLSSSSRTLPCPHPLCTRLMRIRVQDRCMHSNFTPTHITRGEVWWAIDHLPHGLMRLLLYVHLMTRQHTWLHLQLLALTGLQLLQCSSSTWHCGGCLHLARCILCIFKITEDFLE